MIDNFYESACRSLKELSEDMQLPHLEVDEQGRSQFRYNDEFNLELIVNPDGYIQLYAYIIQYFPNQDNSKFHEKLLLSNASGLDYFGYYWGLDKVNGFYSLNYKLHVSRVDANEIVKELGGFITTASEVKKKMSDIETDPSQAKGHVDANRGREGFLMRTIKI